MAEPLTIAVIGVGLAVGALNNGPLPASGFLASEPTIEQLYRDGGRVMSPSYMNLAEADRVCPSGHEVRKQGQRIDGVKVYITWTLRCR